MAQLLCGNTGQTFDGTTHADCPYCEPEPVAQQGTQEQKSVVEPVTDYPPVVEVTEPVQETAQPDSLEQSKQILTEAFHVSMDGFNVYVEQAFNQFLERLPEYAAKLASKTGNQKGS
jgi:hypothetical protein